MEMNGVWVMCKWLDTQTEALLMQSPPDKYAPPDTGMYTLVLLEKGRNPDCVLRSLSRVPGISDNKATSLITRPCPFSVAANLSIADALLGQFELICSDCVSIFLRGEIFSSASPIYLETLYSQVRRSAEFHRIQVSVNLISTTDIGKRFFDQFFPDMDMILDEAHPGNFKMEMMRKKARIMAHWAAKIGVEVTIMDSESGI